MRVIKKVRVFQSTVETVDEEESQSVEENDLIDVSDSESKDDSVGANESQGRGRGRGHPATGGRGAARAGRGIARGAHGVRVDPAQQAALEAQWVSAFTGSPGIKVPLPNNPSTGDILSLFLTDEFL